LVRGFIIFTFCPCPSEIVFAFESPHCPIDSFVNEMKNAGSYKVQFDGTDYPSGIYYYRIKAGNYEQVKKMMLIR